MNSRRPFIRCSTQRPMHMPIIDGMAKRCPRCRRDTLASTRRYPVLTATTALTRIGTALRTTDRTVCAMTQRGFVRTRTVITESLSMDVGELVQRLRGVFLEDPGTRL